MVKIFQHTYCFAAIDDSRREPPYWPCEYQKTDRTVKRMKYIERLAKQKTLQTVFDELNTAIEVAKLRVRMVVEPIDRSDEDVMEYLYNNLDSFGLIKHEFKKIRRDARQIEPRMKRNP